MAHLLVPPQRSETTRGCLWWKKSSVEFRIRILTPEQAAGCGISMFRALAAEFPNRKRIESLAALIIGDVEPTFHAYESFLREADSTGRVYKWVLEEVPYFSLGFETTDGQIIRSYDYETVDGRRVISTARPMNENEQTAAAERVKAGLQSMIADQHGGP